MADQRVIKASEDGEAAIVIRDDGVYLSVGSNFFAVTSKGLVESGKKGKVQGSDNETTAGMFKGVPELDQMKYRLVMLPGMIEVKPQKEIQAPIMPLLSLVKSIGWFIGLSAALSIASSVAGEIA